jgi:hypothetical protein
MTLSPDRVRSYSAGALTGVFAALAAVARRDGHRSRARALLVLAAVCGAAAVGFEERAQAADGYQ